MKISTSLKKISSLLKNISDSYFLESRILLAHFLKQDQEFIITNPDYYINSNMEPLWRIVEERISYKPIAYIIGYKEFYNLKFFVNKDVLVPRPDSECIIDSIIDYYSLNPLPNNVLELGCGSGCLIIALTKKFNY